MRRRSRRSRSLTTNSNAEDCPPRHCCRRGASGASAQIRSGSDDDRVLEAGSYCPAKNVRSTLPLSPIRQRKCCAFPVSFFFQINVRHHDRSDCDASVLALAMIAVSTTAHVFRHSAATAMAERGVPMAEIAQFLGHADHSLWDCAGQSRLACRPQYCRPEAARLFTHCSPSCLLSPQPGSTAFR
jgi:hypothetical protein